MDYIVKGNPNAWDIDYWMDDLTKLFLAVKEANNSEAWKVSEDTINFLGEIGFRDFRRLLSDTDDQPSE